MLHDVTLTSDVTTETKQNVLEYVFFLMMCRHMLWSFGEIVVIIIILHFSMGIGCDLCKFNWTLFFLFLFYSPVIVYIFILVVKYSFIKKYKILGSEMAYLRQYDYPQSSINMLVSNMTYFSVNKYYFDTKWGQLSRVKEKYHRNIIFYQIININNIQKNTPSTV